MRRAKKRRKTISQRLLTSQGNHAVSSSARNEFASDPRAVMQDPPPSTHPRIEEPSDTAPPSKAPTRRFGAYVAAVLTTAAFCLTVGYGAGYSAAVSLVPSESALAHFEPEATATGALQKGKKRSRSTGRPESVAVTESKRLASARVSEAAVGATPGLHLQVSALRSRSAAAALGQSLGAQGYPIRLLNPHADGLVRVLVGPASDRSQLAAWSNRLRQAGLSPFAKKL